MATFARNNPSNQRMTVETMRTRKVLDHVASLRQPKNCIEPGTGVGHKKPA
jgi:predicted O-methyltransferase YrrM